MNRPRCYNVAVAFALLTLTLFPALSASESAAQPLPAFQGASGFGATTVAGSGRHLRKRSTRVVRVRSLAASGPDTLKSCVDAAGPRVCVFETSGVIELTKELIVTKPYLTIAGQTAPRPGILIRGAGLSVRTHDVLVQHIALRVGDAKRGPNPVSRDGLSILGRGAPGSRGAWNVVVDHVSVSWALDENVSTWFPGVHDVTISNSIIAEGLYKSIHPKGPHGMGVLVGDGSRNISIRRSVLAHNNERNAYFKPATSGEMVNNIVYNWGRNAVGGVTNVSDVAKTRLPVELDFVGNIFLPGASSAIGAAVSGADIAPATRIFVLDNVCATRQAKDVNEWFAVDLPEVPYRSFTSVVGGSPALPVESVIAAVARGAGSRPAERNAVDQRILHDIRIGTGDIKDCISGCPRSIPGGWPKLAVVKRRLRPPVRINSDDDRNGYTNLEDWVLEFSNLVDGTVRDGTLPCGSRKVTRGKVEYGGRSIRCVKPAR